MTGAKSHLESFRILRWRLVLRHLPYSASAPEEHDNYGKPNGHAQKAVRVQRGQVVGTRNTSVCSENVSSVFSYWLFSIQSYKISQGSYAWVHNDICIVKKK